jgi:hypothetical protein
MEGEEYMNRKSKKQRGSKRLVYSSPSSQHGIVRDLTTERRRGSDIPGTKPPPIEAVPSL